MKINGYSITAEQLAKVYNGRISLEPVDKDDISCYTLDQVIKGRKYKIELNSQELYAYQSRLLTPIALRKLCLQIGEEGVRIA